MSAKSHHLTGKPENKFACEAQGTSVIENSFQLVAQAAPLHELGLGYMVSVQPPPCRSWSRLAHLRHRFLAPYFISVSDYRSQVTGINPLEHRMNRGPHNGNGEDVQTIDHWEGKKFSPEQEKNHMQGEKLTSTEVYWEDTSLVSSSCRAQDPCPSCHPYFSVSWDSPSSSIQILF